MKKANETPPLMVGRVDAARMFGVSEATWDRKVAAGKTPAPVKLGSRTLFRRTDLELWLEHGFPDRTTFEALTRKR